MKTVTKVFAGIIALVTMLLQVPQVQAGLMAFVTAHPTISTMIGGMASLMALLHVPTQSQ